MREPSDWTSNPDLLAAAGVAAALARAGVAMRLSANGQQLLVTGPAGAVTPDLAAQIRANRRELLMLAAFFPAENVSPADETVEARELRWAVLDRLYSEKYGAGLADLPVSLRATKAGDVQVTMADDSTHLVKKNDE